MTATLAESFAERLLKSPAPKIKTETGLYKKWKSSKPFFGALDALTKDSSGNRTLKSVLTGTGEFIGGGLSGPNGQHIFQAIKYVTPIGIGALMLAPCGVFPAFLGWKLSKEFFGVNWQKDWKEAKEKVAKVKEEDTDTLAKIQAIAKGKYK